MFQVYMYNGSVHLVRIDHQPKIEVGQAVSMVRFQPSVTIASPEIQAAISTRISGWVCLLKYIVCYIMTVYQ